MGLLSLVCVGCKRPTANLLSLRVTRLVVSEVGESERAPIGEAALHAAAERGLLAAGLPVAEGPGDAKAGDFQLRMQLQTEAIPNTNTLRVLCAGLLSARKSARLDPPDNLDSEAAREAERRPELSKLEHVGITEKTFGSPPDAAQVASLARRLVEDTAHTLGEQAQLLGMESRALIATAGKPDVDAEVRKTAIQILGQRKEKLAVPVLIALVKDRQGLVAQRLGPESDAEKKFEARQAVAVQQLLRDTAIGALVEIGDQSAVRPLLDSVAFRDHMEMGKLVAAVASLGGPEARSYLQFVRGSHPEASIRAEAEKALERLDQHAARHTPTPR